MIFGSAVKGKEFVGDIDVALVFTSNIDMELVSSVEKLNELLHVAYLKLDEIYSQPLWITLIREGFSISKNKFIREIMGLESSGLFTYDIRHIKNKSRFSQVLKGYKTESVLKQAHGEILKPGVALIPIEYVEYFRTFLKTWNAKYTLKHILR